jgi:hypothetical protein
VLVQHEDTHVDDDGVVHPDELWKAEVLAIYGPKNMASEPDLEKVFIFPDHLEIYGFTHMATFTKVFIEVSWFCTVDHVKDLLKERLGYSLQEHIDNDVVDSWTASVSLWIMNYN